MLKKIDILLTRGFFPPFFVTFCIAIFVLVMQGMWRYVDDIIGKGAGLPFILEILFYLSVSLIPMALPIGVLISSVMIMGNLAERFELTSLKSAGIPLLRVMRPMIFICTCIAIFSWVCANYLIPVSVLKFKTRISDVRNQKPVMSMEEGVFNEDFEDFVIYFAKKESDNSTIHDVIVYESQKTNNGKVGQIHAESGQMYTRDNDRYFVMNLKNGVKYEELKPADPPKRGISKRAMPYVRTYFEDWTYTFDMSEFDMTMSSEDDRKKHYRMMSSAQLLEQIDTLQIQIEQRKERLGSFTRRYFHPLLRSDQDTNFLEEMIQTTHTMDTFTGGDSSSLITDRDSLAEVSDTVDTDPDSAEQVMATRQQKAIQSLDKPIAEYASFISTFEPSVREQLYNRAKSSVRSISGNSESISKQLQYMHEKYVKTVFEFHSKLSMAMVCIIFLFIGAPMGAIVRKGGFGYPILVAIIFFTLFIIMSIAFKNMAEEHILTGATAAWLPCIILFPIGLVLTYQAMNDRKLFTNLRLITRIKNLFSKTKHEKSLDHG